LDYIGRLYQSGHVEVYYFGLIYGKIGKSGLITICSQIMWLLHVCR